ncbi:MAG TPA: sigma-54 dependent transcriptional regulator [Humidesulfovibrio sp.]|uniref:sigma-54-dependent transcriptional regulator n=1 Tax=Humidesulfovibrio sp. TaxID=2910988 RepID=UPI002C455703|nr:sigma-54 dependent transcriptional regulator [Humidesulfovibrio sp.]HWR03962.1 sigma-54 dependent transcriptional regulator [Humidesulfovibrio sp.]
MESTKREHATILVVDDDKNILQVLEARLSFAHYKTLSARSAEEAVELLAQHPVDLVVSDVKMPGMGGVGLLHEILVQWPHIPVILLTAYGSIPDAVSTIRSGAADYLTKPFDGHQLLQKIAALLGRVAEEPKRAPAPKAGKSVSDVIWGGQSPVMRDFYALLERVAPTDVAVLILGESGTGKEMVARMLHDLSPRAKGPFVIVDCGSTQPTLLESELFGHVKGSFTHAVRDKKGLMEEADGGTLFLDEIGNISPEMQTRLLRFLQERTIRRVGDTRAIPVNCRVVAATNADLPSLVKKGEFREDLYFRLKVVTLKVPPLRERKEDIPLLTDRFLETFSANQNRPRITASPETLALLMAHSWPGNVRELRHALEGGVVFCAGQVLTPRDVQLEQAQTLHPDPVPAAAQAAPVVAAASAQNGLSLEENEHQAIIRALEKAAWVKKNAADLLGISRRAIHYKIKKYNIQIPGKDQDE